MKSLGTQIDFSGVPSAGVSLQAEPEPVSMKTKIADALIAVIENMKKMRYVAFDKVKLYASDFNDTELPAAQFIDNTEAVSHVRQRKNAMWMITLEIVDKSDENGYVSQRSMWNLEYQIARALWKDPQLGVKGVVQATYLSNNTDLHMLEPYYLLRMDFQIEYHEALVDEC